MSLTVRISSGISSANPALTHIFLWCIIPCCKALQWCHNGSYGVSNRQRLIRLLNCLFRRRSKKTSKLRVTGLCEVNPLVTGEFRSKKASNTENVSILWRHRGVSSDYRSVISKFILSDSPENATHRLETLWMELVYCSHCFTFPRAFLISYELWSGLIAVWHGYTLYFSHYGQRVSVNDNMKQH